MHKLNRFRSPAFFGACIVLTTLSTGIVLKHVCAAQTSNSPVFGNTPQVQTGMPSVQTGMPSVHVDDGSVTAHQEDMRLRQAMDERHKHMVDDTDKLLELVTELKSDVDKSSKYETSVAAIKKAAEIEKVAHDVKERMRN